METFKQYVKKFEKLYTKSGYFARDVKRDPNFPEWANKGELLKYLKANRASKEAISNFKALYKLYETDVIENDSELSEKQKDHFINMKIYYRLYSEGWSDII